jgi:hypothetical protein
LRATRADQIVPLVEQVIAEAGDDQLGIQRLAGVPGRALILAAAALGARERLQELLAVEVPDLPGHSSGVPTGLR